MKQSNPRPARFWPIILHFLKGYKRFYALVLVLTLATSVLESFSVAAFFPLFTSLLGDPQGDSGGFLGILDDLVGVVPISDPIVAASVFLIVIILAKALATLIREGMIAFTSAKVFYNVRARIMERYAGAHYQFFLDSKQGALMYNNLVAPNAIGNLMQKGPQLIGLLLKVVMVAVVLGLIFPVAVLVLAILGLLFYGVFHVLSGKVSLNIGRGRTASGTELTVIHNEFQSGIHQIISLGAIRHWADRFDRQNKVNSYLYGKQRMWLAAPRPVVELAAVGMLLGFVLILRGFNTGDFGDILPKLGIVAMALMQVLPAVASVGGMRMELMAALPDMELAFDAITGPLPARVEGNRQLKNFEKAIVFEDASFAHKGRETLLDSVNLKFEKGEVTAIVGPSGGGKTTLINLILGLFQPTGGRITVDGIPVQELKQDSWLSKIGFVSQEPFTFHSTIADNITFGRDGLSQESVIKSAKIANAHGFISELPLGYDTMVGDRGMKLSAGQQQRIAIARAVIDDPEILIFDEATSALDTLSEKLVQEAIDNVSANRTVIIIAHRLSTVRQADKIIVIDRGEVVESGTHQELLEQHGDYARMVAASR